MDDLNEKLAGILKDPQSMERVRQMAQSILAGNEEPAKEPENGFDLGSLADSVDLGSIINIVSKLNSSQDDQRTHLISALRPYLSEKRQEKADNAVKILKLLELLPLLKESGLFK